MIFETERLKARLLEKTDIDLFFELMSNPNVMDPIPHEVFSREESNAKLAMLMLGDMTSDIRVWSLTEKENNDFIGLVGLLINDEGDQEIAYRLIERYWGVGYGTEIAKGLIQFAFEKFNATKVTADVNIENIKSAKILNKFFHPVREFYNKKDKCTDRRYEIGRGEWFV